MDPPPVVPLLGGLYEIWTGLVVDAVEAEEEEVVGWLRLALVVLRGGGVALESSLRNRTADEERSRACDAERV